MLVYFFEIVCQKNAFSKSEFVVIATQFSHLLLLSSNRITPGNHEHRYL